MPNKVSPLGLAHSAECAIVEADAANVTLSDMGLNKVWVIPLFTFIFSLAAFLVSYVMAASLGHVSTFWPYISDSGAFPPESCVFGQLLNMAALFLAITVYLRHRQIVEFYWHRFKQVGRWRNVSCGLLWLGYTSAFGVSMVANFQENHVIYVHYAGALLAFGCGLIYTWAQTVFSYMMNPKLARPIVSHARLVLCLLSSVFFVSMVVFGPILGRQPKSADELDGQEGFYKWSGHEPNYVEHMIGTCSEWLLAICFQMYILSFAIELRHAYCHAPKLKLIAFLDGEESAVSTDVFDCCVVPAKILTGVNPRHHEESSSDDDYKPATTEESRESFRRFNEDIEPTRVSVKM
ncbi:unnamed protein product [Bursaphelenchus xylophilus]|uniref:(pine wood nematode) hypothetical protein n=1 Tax=Bursaphelenchus xylophilus TaxID=6326 RepID=A0A1I7SA33_BURXY|nr:unnamed protein product [Bursaphelenchus xylophilus]CAG9131787.1 unnamed protein product [Bursaphelenchus xylophilus]